MHFGSQGTCYGFGGVAKYCDVSGGRYGVTVGKYGCKKGESLPTPFTLIKLNQIQLHYV